MTEIDILLVYGQSNARGYANGTPGDPAIKTPDVTVWDGTTTIPLTNYMPTQNDGASTGGAWVAFANEYAYQAGRQAIIANCGRGSQSIAALSKGAANTNYSGMVAWVDGIKAHITAAGDTVGKVVVLFCQGEADSAAGTGPATYSAALAQLWADLKADTGAHLLALYTVGYYNNSAPYKIRAWQIQAAQRKFAAGAPDVIVAFDDLETLGALGMKVDDVHLNQRGYNLMGEKSVEPIVSTLFTDGATEQGPMLARHGVINLDGSQEWKFYGGWLVGPDWQPSTVTARACSGIVSVVENADHLAITLADRVDYILSVGATVKTMVGGLVEDGVIDITPEFDQMTYQSVDAQGRTVLKLYFLADVTARVRLAQQTIDTAVTGAGLGPLFVGQNWATGYVRIFHPTVKRFGSAVSRELIPRLVSCTSFVTSTDVRVWDTAGNPANAEVAVDFRGMKVPPSALSNTYEMTFHIIGAEKRPS